MNINKNAFSIALLILTIAMIEFGLRLLTPFPIHSHKANKIDDEILSYRISPSMKDIDLNGFRNQEARDTADIVALGDSQTYGSNVESADSWPQQLATLTDMTVYNFGVPGYGILQYQHLIDAAIDLNPKHVVLGLYLANDLKICKLLKSVPHWNRWSQEHSYNIDVCYKNTKKRSSFQLTNIKLFKYLTFNTAIGSLTSYVWELATLRLNIGQHGKTIHVKHEHNPTIITIESIHNIKKNLDLDNEESSLGFMMAKDIIRHAKSKFDVANVKLSVLFIPSKESVYFNYLNENNYKLPVDYFSLVENEMNLVQQFSSVLDAMGIHYVNAAPYLISALGESDRVYPNSGDGHPLEAGYAAYAEAAHESMTLQHKRAE